MKIRVVQNAGEYVAGQVVDVDDRRGRKLITNGYAEPAGAAATPPPAAKPAAATKESAAVAHGPGRGRKGSPREERG